MTTPTGSRPRRGPILPATRPASEGMRRMSRGREPAMTARRLVPPRNRSTRFSPGPSGTWLPARTRSRSFSRAGNCRRTAPARSRRSSLPPAAEAAACRVGAVTARASRMAAAAAARGRPGRPAAVGFPSARLRWDRRPDRFRLHRTPEAVLPPGELPAAPNPWWSKARPPRRACPPASVRTCRFPSSRTSARATRPCATWRAPPAPPSS